MDPDERKLLTVHGNRPGLPSYVLRNRQAAVEVKWCRTEKTAESVAGQILRGRYGCPVLALGPTARRLRDLLAERTARGLYAIKLHELEWLVPDPEKDLSFDPNPVYVAYEMFRRFLEGRTWGDDDARALVYAYLKEHGVRLRVLPSAV